MGWVITEPGRPSQFFFHKPHILRLQPWPETLTICGNWADAPSRDQTLEPHLFSIAAQKICRDPLRGNWIKSLKYRSV